MARTRVAFLDRDGTLIEEPEDLQLDALHKVRLVPGVMPAMAPSSPKATERTSSSLPTHIKTVSAPRAACAGVAAMARDWLAPG